MLLFHLWDRLYIIREHAKKANCLIHGAYSIPTLAQLALLSQLAIYEKQEKDFIISRGEVAVLSAIPLYLLEYFDKKIVAERFLISGN